MSDLASYVGASYSGDTKDGKYHGRGIFTFPTGVRYEGAFEDGAFHGEGRLIFPTGAIYTAQWQRGQEVAGSGQYKFKDGLVGPQPAGAWDYLTQHDRRFYQEKAGGGIRPGDSLALGNESAWGTPAKP